MKTPLWQWLVLAGVAVVAVGLAAVFLVYSSSSEKQAALRSPAAQADSVETPTPAVVSTSGVQSLPQESAPPKPPLTATNIAAGSKSDTLLNATGQSLATQTNKLLHAKEGPQGKVDSVKASGALPANAQGSPTNSAPVLGVQGNDTLSEGFRIRWAKQITEADELEKAPAIIYTKSPSVSCQQVLIKVRIVFSEEGQSKTLTTTLLQPIEVGNVTGTIKNDGWTWNAKQGLMGMPLNGRGNATVALFDVAKKPGTNEADAGRQLSNWLEIPVTFPDRR
jgi:hypothetical protein